MSLHYRDIFIILKWVLHFYTTYRDDAKVNLGSTTEEWSCIDFF